MILYQKSLFTLIFPYIKTTISVIRQRSQYINTNLQIYIENLDVLASNVVSPSLNYSHKTTVCLFGQLSKSSDHEKSADCYKRPVWSLSLSLSLIR